MKEIKNFNYNYCEGYSTSTVFYINSKGYIICYPWVFNRDYNDFLAQFK